jgi:hypothetical protein
MVPLGEIRSINTFPVAYYLFMFFRVEENEPKEDARVPRRYVLPCASPIRPERAETRFAQTVRALFSGRIVDARRGTKGMNPETRTGHLPDVQWGTQGKDYNPAKGTPRTGSRDFKRRKTI